MSTSHMVRTELYNSDGSFDKKVYWRMEGPGATSDVVVHLLKEWNVTQDDGSRMVSVLMSEHDALKIENDFFPFIQVRGQDFFIRIFAKNETVANAVANMWKLFFPNSVIEPVTYERLREPFPKKKKFLGLF